ncbi:unnamed protein product, partial [Mesorhabditis belari]|uniref:Uncharacterized protein n=1 Tax=Mesorhabditis belari TaxID=2138241 RepID=A0AAF3F926_9BILA
MVTIDLDTGSDMFWTSCNCAAGELEPGVRRPLAVATMEDLDNPEVKAEMPTIVPALVVLPPSTKRASDENKQCIEFFETSQSVKTQRH